MRILHAAPIYLDRATGPSGSVVGLGDALIRNGISAALLPTYPIDGKIDTLMKVLPSPKKEHRNPWCISHEWLTTIEKEFGVPHCLDFHDIYTPFHAALASLVHRKKRWSYIVTPRGALSSHALRIKFIKKRVGDVLFNSRFIKEARAIHALTDEEAADIYKVFPNKKIFICPNAVSNYVFDLFKRRPAIQRNEGERVLTFVFLGRLDVFHKGIDLLLGAFREVLACKPGVDIRLVVVGDFQSVKDEKVFKRLVGALPTPESVRYVGPMLGEKKWPYLLSANVFVHTSRFEGMPNAVLEALALGIPCLVTPGTNMAKFIRSHGAGWVAESSVKSIARTILEIEDCQSEIESRGIKARKAVQASLTWDRVAINYVSALERIL